MKFELQRKHALLLAGIETREHLSKRCIVSCTSGIVIFFNSKANMFKYSAKLRFLHNLPEHFSSMLRRITKGTTPQCT